MIKYYVICIFVSICQFQFLQIVLHEELTTFFVQEARDGGL